MMKHFLSIVYTRLSLCKAYLASLFMLGALVGCAPQPDHPTSVNRLPIIFPDYTDVTLPPNIAPLNFQLTDSASAVSVEINGETILSASGSKAIFDLDDWKQLLKTYRGQTVKVKVYAQYGDQWRVYKSFAWTITNDSIDPYLSYRMISPSYVSYEELTLNQRCLENDDEEVMVDNMLSSTEEEGQCVNCHSYKNYRPDRMQFHARQNHGGTFIMEGEKRKKVALKNDNMLSAGVYPAWHPQLNLIAYSTNKTVQSFHTRDINKIEVLDGASDLVLYDVDTDKITTIEARNDEFETYPSWSPDGRYLYYSSAHLVYPGDTIDIAYALQHAQDIKYNIYRKAFDPQTRQFGPRELVFAADSIHQSATLPRISPDGRWLLFSMGSYGCFHIWHKDADLWMMDLQSKKVAPLTPANSAEAESYHTWSSNGRWVVFSSRRDDGVYTRLYFTHIDRNGHASKPFELPQTDPGHAHELLKSYNIPELMKGHVDLTPQEAARVMR